MTKTPSSVYKYYAKNFQKKAKTIDDIRLASKDMQLLCYLYYNNCISDTEFKKLKRAFELRCDCAHPTDIVVSTNQIIVIFEDVYNLIFNNEKICI